jgi:hypothetical protein
MLFHVTIEVHDAIVLDDDKRLREVLGPQIQKVMESGKVQESGFLTGKRGGFFLLNIDDPADLYELLGPEIYSTCRVEAQPVTPIEKGGELFQRWAAEGR